jgi:hypothetical protein
MSQEDEYNRILLQMKTTAHGSRDLREFSRFLVSLKKKRRELLQQKLMQEPIPWEFNKERKIWKTEEEALENQYWFLQGYVIDSGHVIGPRGVESHRQWLVISVDCDCVRAPYVHLGKIVPVDDSQEGKERLSLASAFKSHRLFPLPPFNDSEIWSIAELETPYYIERKYIPLSTPLSSLTIDGWHILNAFLQERYTRAINDVESESLRAIP